MKKQALRDKMKALRKVVSKQEKQAVSDEIFKKLSGLKEYKEAKNICVYMDSFNEVKTDLIIEDLRKNKKTVVFPITDIKTNTLSLCCDTGEFKEGAYGILEPYPPKKLDVKSIDLIIIPGLAFSEDKSRLGFGGGFYDRLLKECNAFKIAICYDFQVLDQIPSEEHDIKPDMIITEKRVIF